MPATPTPSDPARQDVDALRTRWRITPADRYRTAMTNREQQAAQREQDARLARVTRPAR